jgi:hypothetical protein
MYIRMYVCMYVCMYVYMPICMHVWIHTEQAAGTLQLERLDMSAAYSGPGHIYVSHLILLYMNTVYVCHLILLYHIYVSHLILLYKTHRHRSTMCHLILLYTSATTPSAMRRPNTRLILYTTTTTTTIKRATIRRYTACSHAGPSRFLY